MRADAASSRHNLLNRYLGVCRGIAGLLGGAAKGADGFGFAPRLTASGPERCVATGADLRGLGFAPEPTAIGPERWVATGADLCGGRFAGAAGFRAGGLAAGGLFF